jgi:hypothetical protein
MATLADIRRAALALPDAAEVEVYGGPWFQVGRKSFVLFWTRDERWIFKLPHPRQDLLFEARPEVFQPYRSGAMVWSYVDIKALNRTEATAYVTEAWTMVAPKKVSRAYLGARS